MQHVKHLGNIAPFTAPLGFWFYTVICLQIIKSGSVPLRAVPANIGTAEMSLSFSVSSRCAALLLKLTVTSVTSSTFLEWKQQRDYTQFGHLKKKNKTLFY